MKTIVIDFKNPDKRALDLIVSYFLKGKIVAFPTDTIYGLGCLAINKSSIKKIFKIKKRSPRKALLVLVKSIAQLKKFSFVSSKQEDYLKKSWPGPISVILRKKDGLPGEIAPGGETVAFRLPKNDFLIKILRRVDKPIVATSLNISGKQSLKNVSGLDKYFKTGDIDLVVDIEDDLVGKPSKLIDLTNTNNINILRK